MKAAVLREVNQPLVVEDLRTGDPGPREVLIRTAAAGVCHSDLHFQNGSYPYPLPSVLGHESAGVVEAWDRRCTTSNRATTSSPACRRSAATASTA